MITLLLVFVVICVSLWCWWLRIIKNGSGPILNGCVPIIGHTHKIIGNTEKLWDVIKDISTGSLADGGISRMILAMETYYVITDPEDIVTVGNSCLEKHFSFGFAKPWLGDGLITGTESVWKRHRKLINPAFSLQIIQGFIDVFNATSREMVDSLAIEVNKGPINASSYFHDNGMKNLSQTALGIGTTEEGSTLFRKYMRAVDEILEVVVMRFQNVWLQNNLIYKLIGLKKKEADLIKVLNNMSDSVIKEKRSKMDNAKNDTQNTISSGPKSKMLLELLLELSDDSLTDKEIREEVDTFMVAGTDTSAWLVNYVCSAIGTYPHVQEKMVKELEQTFVDSDRDVDKVDLQKLVYVEAVIKETLRLYPIGPVSLRTVSSAVRLKNHYLRPGDHIIMSFYGVNRHAMWGPDANHFRPERWLEVDSLPKVHGGFGIGKRSCIGKSYAMMSIKILLVHLLRRYRIHGDITKLKLKMDFIAKPASGHHIALTERSSVIRKKN